MILRDLQMGETGSYWRFAELRRNDGLIFVWQNCTTDRWDLAFYDPEHRLPTQQWTGLDELAAQCVLNHLLADENNRNTPVA